MAEKLPYIILLIIVLAPSLALLYVFAEKLFKRNIPGSAEQETGEKRAKLSRADVGE